LLTAFTLKAENRSRTWKACYRFAANGKVKVKRRQFISLASIAAIGTPLISAAKVPATEGVRWQPDGVGSMARIGVLTPDFDPVPESEMWAMAPQGLSIHASRVMWNHDAASFAQPPHVDHATEQLVGLRPQAIIYAFTSSSYALGAAADDPLRVRLEKRADGVPVVLTCQAATEALRSFEARRIALIQPPWFSEEVNAKGRDYFRSQGFEVVLCTRLTPARSFTEVAPSEVYQWVTANVPLQAQAVFIGGNGLRAIGTIQALEHDLGKPVLTANQVSLWKALRLVGSTSMPTQYGRVFTLSR
jgi:maleate isomerase